MKRVKRIKEKVRTHSYSVRASVGQLNDRNTVGNLVNVGRVGPFLNRYHRQTFSITNK
jgi:hypothetical protein